MCAIVCKSGRVCGLRHTAADCVNKKAAHPEMAVPKPRTAESPRIELSQPTEKEDITRWRAPTPLPSGSSGGRPWHRPPSGARQQDDMRAGDTRAASATADVQGEPPADQSSEAGKEDVWANHYDKLAIKSLRRGNKFRPEPPTLIAKICKSGGELWLGGLPTERYLPPAPECGFALQVCCMKSAPEDRVIDDKKKGTFTRGVTMPNVILVKLNMDNPDAAARGWPSVSKLVVKSLRQGDNAFVHCMAGVHRAGLAGSMLRAHLHDETLDKAIATIKKVRHVEPEKCLVNQPRCRDMVAKGTSAGWMSRPVGWAAATKLIHAVILSGENSSPQPACQWSHGDERASRVSSRLHVHDKLSSLMKTERATADICVRCLQNLPATMLREAAMAGFCKEENKISSEATSFSWIT